MVVRKQSYRNPFERGVTTVEGAIVLTGFFMLLFGVIEAGRFLSTRQVLTNAAREGARFGVAPTPGTNTLPGSAEIITRVNSYLAGAHITGATTTTKCPAAAAEACTLKVNDGDTRVNTGLVNTEYTLVTVTKPFTVIAFPVRFSALSITLTGKALMRRETSD